METCGDGDRILVAKGMPLARGTAWKSRER
jgi:hypothetical protein